MIKFKIIDFKNLCKKQRVVFLSFEHKNKFLLSKWRMHRTLVKNALENASSIE